MALGTLISSPIRPLSTSMTIPVAYADEIKGGFHSVDDVSDRDLIYSNRREFGMLVYVRNTTEFYQLQQVSSSNEGDNLNWVLVNVGGSSSSTWINPAITRTSIDPSLLTPSNGDRYLIVSGTGLWFGYDDYVVEWNGSWQYTAPVEALTLRINDEYDCVYSYIGGVWVKQSYVTDPFMVKYDIPLTDSIVVGTGSEYLIYGDLNVDGTLDTWGKVVVVNGSITGTVSLLGSGTVSQIYLLDEIYGGTGVSIVGSGSTARILSTNLIGGTGVTISLSGSSWFIGNIPDLTAGLKYYIGPTETVIVPDYEEYFLYGDLEVDGTLDIGTYGKVVIINGDFIAASGSVVNNSGNVELYDFVTFPEISGPVNYLPKYGVLGITTSSVYDINGTFSQTNVNNGFQLINSDIVNVGFATNSIAGSYWNDGFGVYRVSGIVDSTSNGGTFGACLGTFDSNTNILSQAIVENGSVYISVNKTTLSESRVIVTQSSVEMSYLNLGTSQYNNISIGENKIKNYIDTSATFSIESSVGNLFSISDTGTISIGTVSNDNALTKLLAWDDSTGDVKYVDSGASSGKHKTSYVLGASFSGTPLIYSVTFSTPYLSTDYSITVTGEIPRSWSVQNKTINGFDINTNSTRSFTESVYWYCMDYGEN